MTFRSLFAALCVVLLVGCAPKHIDPPLFTYDTSTLTLLSAQARARDIDGRVFVVLGTHSMEPVLWGWDYITVNTHIPVDNVKVGQLITYHADWLPPTADPVTHRVVETDKDGFLMAGDNVKPDIDPRTGQNVHSEARWRVTKANYIGVVDGIYRTKP